MKVIHIKSFWSLVKIEKPQLLSKIMLQKTFEFMILKIKSRSSITYTMNDESTLSCLNW